MKREIIATSQDFQRIRHEIVSGLVAIRRAFDKMPKENDSALSSLSLYEAGMTKLLTLVDEIDEKYLKEK